MAGYGIYEFLERETSITLGASETTQITAPFKISAADSLFMLIRVTASAVTLNTAITAKLQHSWDGGTTWAETGSDDQVSITGNGTFEIAHNHENTNSQQLYPLARVVITTGITDAVTADSVLITRRS